MAGSYLHLHLANGAFRCAFDAAQRDRPREHAAFLAGSLGPDLGFFPKGPTDFSRRVHHEHTADLVRSLLAAASDEVETAFAAGWALHVCTDVTTHPVVNRRADRLRRRRSVYGSERNDLWHKRVEWGIDCHVLSALEPGPLWRSELLFPAADDRPSLLAGAAGGFFGEEADDRALRAGWASARRWIRRLGPVFAWTGSCRSPARGRPAAAMAPLLRPLARGAALLLEDRERLEDAVAVLSPEPPPDAFTGGMLEAGVEAVELFQRHWREGFESFPNLDLDTGDPIPQRSG